MLAASVAVLTSVSSREDTEMEGTHSKPFGQIIREARQKHGLSIRDVAKMCGVSHTYISMVETDRKEKCSLRFIMTICDYLGLDKDKAILAAGKLPADVHEFLLNTPGAIQQVREMMAERGISEDEE